MKYALIKEHEPQYPVCRLCHVMQVNRAGYYAWRKEPVTPKQQEGRRISGLIRQLWLESGGVYGCRKIIDDLYDLGERCGKSRVYHLMKAEGLRAQAGYHRRPGKRYGKPAVVAQNHVETTVRCE